MSRQAWLISPKIREVDDLLCRNPSLQGKVREVHPEISFFFLAGKQPMQYNNKKPEGFSERLSLLMDYFGEVVQKVLAERRPADFERDDVLDAFAALWTAERIIRGEAETIPKNPPVDRHGLRMAIVA